MNALLPLLSTLAATLPAADVELASIFGDHMVLQRDTDAPIWGTADPGESVTVRGSWSEKEQTAVAGDDGRFRVAVATPAAGGPHEIVVRGKNEVVLRDVMVGEVWICSGQSNMEWSLAASQPNVVDQANAPNIRLFDVKNTTGGMPLSDCTGTWAACTPQSARGFSGVGYFFGRELNEELNVPIGLIGSNWGGTVAESWTSERTVREFPEFARTLDALESMRMQPEAVEAKYTRELEHWWNTVNEAVPASRGWMDLVQDDSGWATHDVPGNWEQTEIGNFDGIVWYRKTFSVPLDWEDRELVLTLGPVDDMDTTWFNGERVGGMERPNAWNEPREYRVPAEVVRAGARNVLCVRVLDTGGGGGFHGKPEQMRLAPAEGAPTEDAEVLSLAGAWRYRAAASLSDLGAWPSRPSFHHNSPTALFNGMIAPLVPFAIRGAIWYQGESNRPRAAQYQRLFPAMITDWREHFGRGDFPFYFVQIAPFTYGGDTGQAAELREAQMMTLSLPQTGMAVTMDIGDPRDIHPRDKKTVGHRLALCALAKTYGREDVVYSGPAYRSMSVEGSTVHLTFNHVAGGLRAGNKLGGDGGDLSHFTIAGEDRRFVPARARIEGQEVIVSSAEVTAPVAVRYGWGAADEPNLFNNAGLPASSFRTDDWPPVSSEH